MMTMINPDAWWNTNQWPCTMNFILNAQCDNVIRDSLLSNFTETKRVIHDRNMWAIMISSFIDVNHSTCIWHTPMIPAWLMTILSFHLLSFWLITVWTHCHTSHKTVTPFPPPISMTDRHNIMLLTNDHIYCKSSIYHLGMDLCVLYPPL